MAQAQLATRFRDVRHIRSALPLSDDDIRRVAPSIFAADKHDSRSARYTYIPTCQVLDGLRKEGFQPFMACQARTRDGGREEYTKHMVRLRHVEQASEEEANEIILVNAHDGTSSYQMLAGVFRFVCHNGLVVGDTVEDLRVPHRGDIVGRVIEGAYRVLDDFEVVNASRDGMKAVTLSEGEQNAFAQAALQLRYDDGAAAPIDARQLLRPARHEDAGNDLWTVFNRTQERLVRGGLRGRNASGRRTTTRPVHAIDQNVRLNRALWTLAEEMAKLKAA